MYELGNWCHQRLVGAPQKKRPGTAGTFHGNPVRANCQLTSTVTEGTSVEKLN